jgi:hypothetical protein
MTTSTSTSSAPIVPGPAVTVTPALGPVPAIYVPRRPAQQGASPSIWHAVGRLAHRLAERAKPR